MPDIPPKFLPLIVDILSFKPTCTSNYQQLCEDVKERLTREFNYTEPNFHDVMKEALENGENVGVLVINGQQVRLRFKFHADNPKTAKADINQEFEHEAGCDKDDSVEKIEAVTEDNEDEDSTLSENEDDTDTDTSSWYGIAGLFANAFSSPEELKSVEDVGDWYPVEAEEVPAPPSDIDIDALTSFLVNVQAQIGTLFEDSDNEDEVEEEVEEEVEDEDGDEVEEGVEDDADDDVEKDDEDGDEDGNENEVTNQEDENLIMEHEDGTEHSDVEEDDISSNCSDAHRDTDLPAAKKRKFDDNV